MGRGEVPTLSARYLPITDNMASGLHLASERFADSLDALRRCDFDIGDEYREYVKSSEELVRAITNSEGGAEEVMGAVIATGSLLLMDFESLGGVQSAARFEVFERTLRTACAMCSVGGEVQLLLVRSGVHLSTLRLIEKLSLVDDTKPQDTLKAGLKLLVNMTFHNDEVRDRMIGDLGANPDLLPVLLRAARKHKQCEPGLIFLTCLVLGSSGRSEKFVSSDYFTRVLDEVMAIWCEDIRASRTFLSALIARLFGALAEFGLIGKITKTCIENENTDERPGIAIGNMGGCRPAPDSPGSLTTLIRFLALESPSEPSLRCDLATGPVYDLLNFLVEKRLRGLGYQIGQVEAEDTVYTLRELLHFVSDIFLTASTVEKLRAVQKRVPHSLREMLLLSNIIFPRRSLRKADSHLSVPTFLFDFKSCIVFCIAALAHENEAAKKAFASLEMMPILLNLCSIDANNPALREYAILAIKVLCEDCPENSRIIGLLTPLDVDEETGSLINEYSQGGLSVELTSRGKIFLQRK